MTSVLQLAPEALADRLRATGLRRGWIVFDEERDRPRASSAALAGLADELASWPDYRRHEAVFLEVGSETGVLCGAFLHRTLRGQAQGGLRHWPYETVGAYLRDGLRLAVAMGRKCALAELWWGGGKGLIARLPGDDALDPAKRRAVFADYGRFVSSLRGCYVTAEDAGTTPLDMAEIHLHTRFATCLPPAVGGSGNPSAMTARGVVRAMQAALDVRGERGLDGARVAMQGAGNVGAFLIEELLARGARIVASEISAERRGDLLDRFGRERLDVRVVDRGDVSILREECDILAPNALGGTLDAKTIPDVRARIVCGAANNPLADPDVDAQRLAERGITYVPDYIANRMGIVACSNEHAGSLPEDDLIQRHLDPELSWPGSIYEVTRRVLIQARDEGTTPLAAANALADERAGELHPIWGHRARRIVESLIADGWAER